MGDSAGGGTGAITALVDALRPIDQAKMLVLRRAAHELRTPLTTVLGFAELLADGAVGPVTEEQRRVLEAVDRNARRLMTLIDAFDPGHPEPARGAPGAPAGGEGD